MCTPSLGHCPALQTFNVQSACLSSSDKSISSTSQDETLFARIDWKSKLGASCPTNFFTCSSQIEALEGHPSLYIMSVSVCRLPV